MNSAARRGRFSGGPAVGVQQFDGLRSARPTIGKPCEPDWEVAAGRGCAPRAWPNGGGGFCEAPPPPESADEADTPSVPFLVGKALNALLLEGDLAGAYEPCRLQRSLRRGDCAARAGATG